MLTNVLVAVLIELTAVVLVSVEFTDDIVDRLDKVDNGGGGVATMTFGIVLTGGGAGR